MSIFDYFRAKRAPTSASLAKERLQIIVAHERNKRSLQQPDYLPQMREEIIAVIRKYIPIDSSQVSVNVDNSENCSVLELNITLPD
ncbi:cell division topological specificity factor MinE [Cellvibrio japonicus]|uniref:Cell division topological specificity factor n=1 Tax=Cellvibrio japonicus (strain Ueda107) TaxID=498211 RepID=MINE_CELJU|nr:cell division topological specificity factor MinE [Cellvibrio japonicus]B3PCV7.1 RecName: Full=Cell division topological specificity factor [Cellvibrio japonicus Ueda107]ACE83866.1 cell division topological specificity factor MinE [Cellvibrio japonicus Ueda107]QEI11905.1 cell division topological specificity factor MinE [Cellvibrio japonicus]QEI15479.1 cell division topological specificity factor MinE [Cellvibrio japonicus]QEI19058.1 cell division topological specificity factor MinE [Cellvi